MSPPDPVTITFLGTDDISSIMPVDSHRRFAPVYADRLSFGVVRHTNVLFVFGTRPEAIKLCPVLLHMRQRDQTSLRCKSCVTAQHRGMLDQVLAAFEVTPDYDLDVMQPGPDAGAIHRAHPRALEPVLARRSVPIWSWCRAIPPPRSAGALAAFYQHDSRRACRSRTAHRRSGAALSRRNEPRGHHAAGRAALRPHARAPRPTWPPKGVARRTHLRHRQFRHRRGALCARRAGVGRFARAAVAAARSREEADRRHRAPARKLRCRLRTASAPRCCGWPARGDVQIAYPVHRNPNVWSR